MFELHFPDDHALDVMVSNFELDARKQPVSIISFTALRLTLADLKDR